jgi:sortase A
MTAVAEPRRDEGHGAADPVTIAGALRDLGLAVRRAGRAASELSPNRALAATSFLVLTAVLLGFCADLAVISPLEYRAAQARSFAEFRNALARGIAPTGPVARKGGLLRLGSPVALLQIPALHMRVVVLDGTTPEVMTGGPGWLRSTVLPGTAGTSVILGRRAAYGGAFSGIHTLKSGDLITVTTGIGTSKFKVIDVRRAGDPLPEPLVSGYGRITLVTATGVPFLPSGVIRVDADLTAPAKDSGETAMSTVPHSEVPMGTDSSTLWQLVLDLQALIIAAVGAVWAWRRWGHAQAWIVFFPVTTLLCYFAADQVTRLLPNLM